MFIQWRYNYQNINPAMILLISILILGKGQTSNKNIWNSNLFIKAQTWKSVPDKAGSRQFLLRVKLISCKLALMVVFVYVLSSWVDLSWKRTSLRFKPRQKDVCISEGQILRKSIEDEGLLEVSGFRLGYEWSLAFNLRDFTPRVKGHRSSFYFKASKHLATFVWRCNHRLHI